MKGRNRFIFGVEGGTLLRLLFFISLMGIVTGIFLPGLLDRLLKVDEAMSQRVEMMIVEQAAQWYVITNGPPDKTMNTDDVKKALIPFYLNKWPDQAQVQCSIDQEGTITVVSRNIRREIQFSPPLIVESRKQP